MEPVPSPSIVVIGASAGGIQALLEVIAELPANFAAPVFVVVHIGTGRSVLPTLLSRGSVLQATHATHGERFEAGHIYVAPPDCHMLVREDRIELSHGPRENHSRPAIDPLFRSAARAHGNRVTGVILSGALGDGSTGLMTIKGHSGTAVVQDPDDAIVESMPVSALRLVEVDQVLTARGIGQYLASMPMPASVKHVVVGQEEEEGATFIQDDFAEQENDRRRGQLTMFTCPDCGGTLWQTADGPIAGFRCHVGHAWSLESLLGQKSEQLEAALWSSVRLLEERATLSRQTAVRIRGSGAGPGRSGRVDDQAQVDEQRADAIRELLDVSLHAPVRAVSHGAEN
ncbi:MAG: chemotaxis protein CheB [Chloroflexota bacterium]|nr:chemotaxis protein CheB [Chloroflexota bacterium]